MRAAGKAGMFVQERSAYVLVYPYRLVLCYFESKASLN